MTYQVPPDVERLIREQVSQGHYASEDDVLRDALAALTSRNADLAAIRAGIEDMEAGRSRPLHDVADEVKRQHGWAENA